MPKTLTDQMKGMSLGKKEEELKKKEEELKKKEEELKDLKLSKKKAELEVLKAELEGLKLSKKKPRVVKTDIWSKFDKLKQEELDNSLKNMGIKSMTPSQKLLARRKERKEKELRRIKRLNKLTNSKGDGDEYSPDSEEKMDLDFGKKQKKDIKGMIKKILLYGGLPTLVVVSLGILSNKKIGKRRLKKNSKIKVSEEEIRFKKVFVKLLKKIILKRKQELSGMREDSKKNVIETNQRQINRQIRSNLRANAALKRQLKINKSSSNPQQASKTPKKNRLSLKIIEERMKKKTPSNKVFLRINKDNREWSFKDEKNSNYYISKGDGKIYNKKGKLTKYIYTEKDGLGKITSNTIIPFIETEQLKKV